MITKEKLKNIFLSNKNPRFNNKFDFNFDGDYFRENQKLDEESDKECIKKILQHEGNYDKLFDLFNSISFEYESELGMPYVIDSNDSDQNKKIVIEGNRRIFVLKCLYGILEFPDHNDYIFDYNKNDDDSELSFHNGDKSKKIDNKIENIFKIRKIISNYKNEKNQLEIDVNIIEKDEKEKKLISIAIFTNHITGDKKGKRNWNRGRTLEMYMNFWKSIKESGEANKIKKISQIINRTESNTRDNLKSALFISYLFEASEKNKEDFLIKNKISSLEIQYIKKFINFGNINRCENNIEINSDLNCEKKLKSLNKNLKIKDICCFILNSLEQKWFSTRGINNKIEDTIMNELSLFFGETSKIEDTDFDKEPKELKNKSINQLLAKKEKFKNENTKSILNFINFSNKENKFKIIYNKDNKIWDEIKLFPFKNTFISLIEQYKKLNFFKNTTKLQNVPINGIASTLRSLIETISYLLMFEEKIFKKFKSNKEIFNQIKNKDNKFFDENVKFDEIYLNQEAQKIYKTYNFMRFIYNNKEDEEKNAMDKLVINLLKKLTKNKKINKIENFHKIFDKNFFESCSLLIHVPHFFYIENKNNNKIKNSFENSKNLLENVFKLLKKLKIIEEK